ncbi:MAG: hypothetical protein Q9165_007163 [Trypethelium subeluteriae]
MNASLLQLSSALINEKPGHDWRDYLRLCLHCYEDLYVGFPLMEEIVQGLMGMAVQNDTLSRPEANEIMQGIRAKGQHHKASDSFISSFTLDFQLASTSPDDAMVRKMALKFDQSTLFNDLVRDVA